MQARFALYLDLIRWNRPAGWLLLLWPTLSALFIASHGWPGWHLVLVFTAGTILMRSAGCCINDVADRDIDKHVKRTAQRPVTSGRVAPREALIVGAVLALAAFALVLTLNRSAMHYSFAALAIAVAYPYAKRVLAMPQAVLGVAFSFGIPMAFAAVRSSVPQEAWWLMLGNLFWVLAYDTQYAMVDRDDDVKTGIKTSAITLGRFDVPAIMLFYVVYLSIWHFVQQPRHLFAIYYIAFFVATLQVAWHYTLIQDRSREGCFKAFRLNHWVGFAVFVAVVAARV